MPDPKQPNDNNSSVAIVILLLVVVLYVVKRGDSLWKIAKKYLGKGSKWPSIYNIPENKKTIGRDPNLIYPGQRLVIPV